MASSASTSAPSFVPMRDGTPASDAAARFRSFTSRPGRAAGIVVASAYGATRVREHGQLAAARWALAAGADGFEVRAELLPATWRDRDSAAFAAGLAATPGSVGYAVIYSTPAELFGEDGLPSLATLGRALREAQAFGAIALKLQLGPCNIDAAAGPHGPRVVVEGAPSTRPDAGMQPQPALPSVQWSDAMDAVVALLRQTNVRLFVENGQTAVGGRSVDFVHLFARLRSVAAWRGAFGMTLDIGNWFWSGEDTAAACAALCRDVEYVHCKGVQIRDARMHAVAPDEGLGPWRAWLATLPPSLPRGLEFPIVGEDPVAATRDALRAVLSDRA